MPAYNCEAFIKQAIDSVLQQTYTNWELIVADDGSADNTRAIIDAVKDERVVKTHNDTNQGNLRTRNRLFDEANGKYLTILDGDDWMSKDKLSTQVSMMLQNRCYDGCVTNYCSVNIHGKVSYQQYYTSTFVLSANYLHNKNVMEFHPASILISREVYSSIGGLHTYFDRLYSEDKYWIFLIVERFKIAYIPKCLYYYRANVNSLTNIVDSPRKLTITDLVKELMRQRIATGQDWLSANNHQAANAYENQLLKSRIWSSERYRSYGARYVDSMEMKKALAFICKAISMNPFNTKCWITLSYWCRKVIIKIH